MPKLYVLVGVPGSGKSTWTKSQHWTPAMEYVSTDLHVEKYAESQGKTYTEVFKDYMPTAVDLMTAEVVAASEAGRDIIWDQTSTTQASRAKKLRMLPDYWPIAVVFATPAVAVLKKRLDNRPGKDVPWEVVKGMIDNFEYPTTDEGFKEIWRV